MEVMHTQFFVVNGISILYLWNIQLTFEQKDSGVMKGIIRHGRAQGFMTNS